MSIGTLYIDGKLAGITKFAYSPCSIQVQIKDNKFELPEDIGKSFTFDVKLTKYQTHMFQYVFSGRLPKLPRKLKKTIKKYLSI